MEHQDTMDRPQMTSLLLFVAIGYSYCSHLFAGLQPVVF